MQSFAIEQWQQSIRNWNSLFIIFFANTLKLWFPKIPRQLHLNNYKYLHIPLSDRSNSTERWIGCAHSLSYIVIFEKCIIGDMILHNLHAIVALHYTLLVVVAKIIINIMEIISNVDKRLNVGIYMIYDFGLTLCRALCISTYIL